MSVQCCVSATELFLLTYRIGVQQVSNFTSVDLVRLAAGYPRLPSGNGGAMYEMLSC